MRVAIVGYRDWAIKLGADVVWSAKHSENEALTKVHISVDSAAPGAYPGFDLTFFVGWSDMVPEEYYSKRLSLVLHPSPLPRYRGGSPIQHQIMQGETVSAVTLFKLDAAYPGVDTGPIAWQMGYSLEGYLPEILDRIAVVGARGVLDCITAFAEGRLVFVPQDKHAPFSVHPRRTPGMSEITTTELGWAAEALYNKVRALQHPYPEAFIRTQDGKRLILERVRVEE